MVKKGAPEVPVVDERKVRNAAMSRLMKARGPGAANRGTGLGAFRAMAREAEKEVAKAHMYLLTPYQPASQRPPTRQQARAAWRRGQLLPGYEPVQRGPTEVLEREPKPMSARLLKRSKPIKSDKGSNAKGLRGRLRRQG